MNKKIESIVNEIIEKENVYNKICCDVKEIDIERLRKIALIAKNGLKFYRIYTEHIAYNDECSDDEICYLKDKAGEYIKGIEIFARSLDYSSGSFGGYEIENKLFFMEDGSFQIFKEESKWSNLQEDCSVYNRIISQNQDLHQFDIDVIIKLIYDELKDRAQSLESKIKTQQNRLNMLKNYKL